VNQFVQSVLENKQIHLKYRNPKLKLEFID
jgi:hypothetical protein